MHRGNAQDSDEAIMLYREALSLCPVGHSGRPLSLNNLATQLSTCFKYQQNPEDLDKAITPHTEALALQPVGHLDRSLSSNNLGNALSFRFEHGDNDQDLDETIKLCRETLSLCPVGHPARFMALYTFAGALIVRFKHGHNGEDLNNALENLRCALILSMQYDPRQPCLHQRLPDIYLLFHQSGLDGTGEDTDNMNAAVHYIKAAANAVSGGLLSRLQASLRWVCYAEEYTYYTLLEAYATSMSLLDAHMSATASVSSRHDAMKAFPCTLAVDAASCALHSGDVCRTVELLEQGRTLIWTQITRFRTPIDTLPGRSDHEEALVKKI
ncbi:hypothetical protein BD769DRAFT_902863 [Suillus cothurnatus]|nr:hypothetical protein BD769DRAFT_902863 [Suillus cothurnatus]